MDANDLDSDAVEAMKRNIQFNGAEAEQRMRPLQGDARVVMLQSPLVSHISIILNNSSSQSPKRLFKFRIVIPTVEM